MNLFQKKCVVYRGFHWYNYDQLNVFAADRFRNFHLKLLFGFDANHPLAIIDEFNHIYRMASGDQMHFQFHFDHVEMECDLSNVPNNG